MFSQKLSEPLSVSIDPICFSINRNCFKFFKRSLCLFRSIKTDFRSIESCELGFFLKRQIWLVQTYFSKVLFKLFSLSKLDKAHLPIFCRFPPDFLQGFPLSKPVSLFCPSFCILLQVFMHFYMNFMGIFGTFQIGIFVDSSFFF